jgi:hypothetical protein
MNVSKLALSFGVLAVALANAGSTYSVTVVNPLWVGQTQLKAGDYKVEVEGDKATFKSGKTMVVEAQAAVEQNAEKYRYTTLETTGTKLKEIHVGNSTVKIVLKDSGNGTTAAGN